VKRAMRARLSQFGNNSTQPLFYMLHLTRLCTGKDGRVPGTLGSALTVSLTSAWQFIDTARSRK
jgi:hypothetical protein